eukprot:7184265-Alexandrium_andersonii.AAC.1
MWQFVKALTTHQPPLLGKAGKPLWAGPSRPPEERRKAEPISVAVRLSRGHFPPEQVNPNYRIGRVRVRGHARWA